MISNAQLQQLWIAAGGDPSQAPTAAAIAQAESNGGDPNIVNNTSGEGGPTDGITGSYGLWQINNAHAGSLGTSWFAMNPPVPYGQVGDSSGPWSDPLTNAQAAVSVYNGAGGFTPWTTYNNGAYLAHMNGASGVPAQALGTGLQMGVALTGNLFNQYASLLNVLDPFVVALIVGLGLMIFGVMGWSNKFASYAAVIIFLLIMIHSSAQNGATPNGTSSASIPPASQITQPKVTYSNVVQNSGSSSSSSGGSDLSSELGILGFLGL